jgi:hypothetical protein
MTPSADIHDQDEEIFGVQPEIPEITGAETV